MKARGFLSHNFSAALQRIKIQFFIWHWTVESRGVQMVCFSFEQFAAQVGPVGGYLHYFAHLSSLTKVFLLLQNFSDTEKPGMHF